MTEEENKAIEILNVVNDTKYTCHYYTIEDLKAIDTVLNLIEKLQKEIEEKTTIIMAGAEKVKQLEKDLKKQEVKENYIPKDKIRELLENNYDISTENSRIMSYDGAFGFVEDIEELLEEEE